MNYKEKIEALAALDDDISIKYRSEEFCKNDSRELESWYVSQNVEVKRGGVLVSVSGNGNTPEEAIEDHWRQATEELKVGEYLVVCAGTPHRKAMKWNGFMWKPVAEKLYKARIYER